jgi:Pyruvate/2-oxoacid:ferredoxin oxidoreductase delta subunit
MAKRQIIKINNEKCNGCGLCIPNCPEGALQIIDNKARLISDLFCDGLGACIGHCPEGAIEIEEREAEPYQEKKVMENIITQGDNTIKAHLEHLKEHGEQDYLNQALEFLKEKGIENPLNKNTTQKTFCGCLGAQIQDRREEPSEETPNNNQKVKLKSELKQWPIQLTLVSPNASYFNDANLLITADCVPFASPNFHQELLKNKSLVIGCPKLDNLEEYKEKITDILKFNNIKTLTVAIMEVPCCYGLYAIVEESVKESGKNIDIKKITIGINGEII